jgi:hypothetical protein
MIKQYKTLIETAINNLSTRRIFKRNTDCWEVRTLFPVERWDIETESWLKNNHKNKDDFYIIGEDSCGNFFIYYPKNYIAFWDHEIDSETVLCNNLEFFLGSLHEPEPVKLKPDQVKKEWIDPDFLKKQKEKGNA